MPRQKSVAKPKEWGRPTALFNTRIPQEMSELLDDLVYRLKKEGKPHTKQTIAIEALEFVPCKKRYDFSSRFSAANLKKVRHTSVTFC
jgi:hypothetical protein